MRKLASVLALCASLALSACLSACATGSNADLSPREQSQRLMLSYAVVQTPAVVAVKSEALADKPSIVATIQAVTSAATAAVVAFDTEARKCIRNADSGELENAPGQTCDPNWFSRAWVAASAAIANASDILKAFGVKVGPAPSD